MRIALCTHVFDRIDYDVYFNHMFVFSNWAKKYDLVFIGKSGLDAAQARNAIAEQAFKHDCTHMLIIDGDHLIPLEMLDCLVETSDQAMVSGVVCKKGERFQQVAFEIKKGDDGQDQYYQIDHPLDGRIYEVTICAFGCTLINMSKLKKLEPPYFRDTFENGHNLRSDVNLCRKFAEIGEKIWVDTRVLIGHVGAPRIIYPQTAEFFKNLRPLERDRLELRHDQSGYFYKLGD